MTHYTDEHLLMLEKGSITTEEFDSLLCDYADNELPKTIRAMMEAKSDSCPVCAELKRTYMLTVKIANNIGQDNLFTDEAKERLRKKLNLQLGINL